jgi:NAD(P)H-hydrate repair Nnr-like enzyme with NAD(P)H-hydrate dehydratase domain
VFIHGLAGDLAADKLTPRALIAGDLIDFFPEVFRLLE